MAAQHYPFDAFVSSSEADHLIAQATADHLQKAGLRVWYPGGMSVSDRTQYLIKG